MNLLEEIETLAGLFFLKPDIETVCELPEGSIDDNPEYIKAFRTGHLKAEKVYWESVSNLAQNGSSPAQELLGKRIQAFKNKQMAHGDD